MTGTAAFVDTSFYIAAVNRRDANHARASDIMHRLRRRMITTEYVLVELGNCLCSVSDRGQFLAMLEHLRTSPVTSVVDASREWLERGLEVYRRHGDKEWSLTDCISFAVMRHHDVSEALTADHHFVQAGFRALLLDNV